MRNSLYGDGEVTLGKVLLEKVFAIILTWLFVSSVIFFVYWLGANYINEPVEISWIHFATFGFFL